ncbi:hypothetical protein AMR75_20930 [Vibrio fluvialis]|nr:hypothetical protein AMR75_20930 [Vibrio fluvialis]
MFLVLLVLLLVLLFLLVSLIMSQRIQVSARLLIRKLKLIFMLGFLLNQSMTKNLLLVTLMAFCTLI